MASNTIHQTNITDFFNTVSTSCNSINKSRKQSLRSKLSKTPLVGTIEDAKAKMQIQNDQLSKTTPKRRTTSTKTTTSKKRKTAERTASTVSITVKETSKTENGILVSATTRTRYPIDFGPIGAIRKLTFDDEDLSDNNNNSFQDFLKSQAEDDTTKSVEMPSLMMNANEVKNRLESCKNLSKLKEHLSAMNGCAEKIKQFKEMKIKYREQDSSNQTRSPVKKLASSPRKGTLFGSNGSPFNSPIKICHSPIKSPIKCFNLPKAPSKKQDEDEAELCLPLPKKYQFVYEQFKLINYHSWRLFKREEMCTFDKLKQIVESSTHRSFTLNMLLKVLSVCGKDSSPKFRLSWEHHSGDVKLVLTPSYHQPTSKCLNSVGILLEREKEFYRLLLDRTRVEHLKFLSEMKLSLSENERIYRWHPMFVLDSVPDIVIDESLLPKKPEQHKTKCTTTSANRQKTILDYFANNRNHEETSKVEGKCLTSSGDDKNKVKSGPLKGISTDLLNKIRAKQAAKTAQLMKRSPEMEREMRTLFKLPDICRIVYDCFLGSSIRSIEFEELVKRIADSMPMSINESRRHLDYLCLFELDLVGTKWIKMIPLNNRNYLQVNTNFPLVELYEAFSKRIKQLKDS